MKRVKVKTKFNTELYMRVLAVKDMPLNRFTSLKKLKEKV